MRWRVSTFIHLLVHSVIQITCKRSGLRILGGRDAEEQGYPYVVSLEYEVTIFVPVSLVKHIHQCTGATLTPTWVLTAAHCLILYRPMKSQVLSIKPVIRYGTLANNTMSEVIYTINNPACKIRVTDARNDVGLVKTTTITLKQYAKISALDFVTMGGQEVTLLGYGLTNSTDGVDSALALKKPLQVLDGIVVKCTKDIKLSPAVCVARRCGQSSSACQGDSGGPMLHPSGIAGVISMGTESLVKFCALKSMRPSNEVGIIAPISPLIDWISDIINI